MEVTELPEPQLEPGTALVRIRACGICGSDLHSYRRGQREDPPGYWWGHEAAGEVVEMIPHPGEEPRVRVGDLVTIDPPAARACGQCGWCLDGAPVHCDNKRAGSDWTGMYAPLAKRDVRGLFPLRGTMDARAGALVEPLAVTVHAVRLAGMREGARVAVLGAGTIGLTALIAARGLGAAEVYVTARHPHQAALAKELGATGVLPERIKESEEALIDLTSGAQADLVIETVGGTAPTVEQAFRLVRRRGTVAVLGLFEHPVPLDVGRALNREATAVFPICYGAFDGVPDFQVAIDLIAGEKTGIEKLATHSFPLAEAVQAFRTADDKGSGAVKVLLEA
ncbi:MAG TPA: zinc-binding dehydrogenase [Chloroflexota bacterium]|nr:zinc-binding dehydrogenase [Chloroflexota bacterium]